jgi:hypothetical protein
VTMSRQIVQRIHSAHSSSTLGTQVKIGEACRSATITIAVQRMNAVERTIASQQGIESVVDPGTEKERGNGLYKRGEKAEAANVWITALQALAPLSVLFSNRALCDLKLPSRMSLIDALLDTTATLTVEPTQMKAYHRQAEASLALDSFDAATAVCEHGLTLVEDSGLREY